MQAQTSGEKNLDPMDGTAFIQKGQLKILQKRKNLNQETLYRLLNSDRDVHMES